MTYTQQIKSIALSMLAISMITGCQKELNNQPDTDKNKAPIITAPDSVAVSHSSNKVIDIEVTDPEGGPVNVSWVIISKPEGGTLSLTAENDFRTLIISSPQVGDYVIQAQASDGFNISKHNIQVAVTNTPPVIEDLTFPKNEYGTVESIIPNQLKLFDADEDVLSISYQWFLNGSLIDVALPYLSPLTTSRGDSVQLSVSVSDGVSSTTYSGPVLNIIDTPPSLSSVGFLLDDIRTLDTIEIQVNDAIDVDGDVVELTYQWYKNGNPLDGFTTPTLPAGIVIKGDELYIEVSATANGLNRSVKSDVITIQDTPSQINLPTIHVAPHNSVAASIEANDPDGEVVNLELVFGPSGMSLKDLNISWNVQSLQLQEQELFHYGVRQVGTETVIRGVINVTSDRVRWPLVRSGIEVPYSNHSIHVLDYDQDGKNEILMTDTNASIYTLQYDGENYIQDWFYPYHVPGTTQIQQLLVGDINNDSKKDIIIISEDVISVITAQDKKAEVLYRASDTESFSGAALGDVNGDGSLELAIATTSGSNGEVIVLTLSENVSVLHRLSATGGVSAIDISNVDADPALEIVLGSGHVFDGITGDNEWYYADGFGSIMTVGDFDGDGIAEIVGTSRWPSPIVYSAVQKSPILELSNSDVCTLNSANIDDDIQDELLLGDCQWGDVYVYDLSSGTQTLQTSWDTVEHASISVTSGDVNNDGVDEVIWGSGITSSGEDVLVVAEQGETTPWHNDNPSQIDYLQAAGWSLNNETPLAVYVAPRTDSGYSGSRIITLSEAGKMTISEEIASNWSNSKYAVITDYDNDDIDEIFLASAQIRDGAFQVRNLTDFSLIHGGEGERDTTIGIVGSFDVNADGYEDAFYSDSNKIMLFDVFNQELIWQSISLGTISDIKFQGGAGTAFPLMLVAASGKLSAWKYDALSGNYIQQAIGDVPCTLIQVGDLLTEEDGSESACILTDSSLLNRNGKSVINILSRDQIVIRSFEYPYVIGDINLLRQGEDISLIAGVNIREGTSSFNSISHTELHTISPNTGDTIWRSPKFIGSFDSHNIYPYTPESPAEEAKIMFSTGSAMYIIN